MLVRLVVEKDFHSNTFEVAFCDSYFTIFLVYSLCATWTFWALACSRVWSCTNGYWTVLHNLQLSPRSVSLKVCPSRSHLQVFRRNPLLSLDFTSQRSHKMLKEPGSNIQVNFITHSAPVMKDCDSMLPNKPNGFCFAEEVFLRTRLDM